MTLAFAFPALSFDFEGGGESNTGAAGALDFDVPRWWWCSSSGEGEPAGAERICEYERVRREVRGREDVGDVGLIMARWMSTCMVSNSPPMTLFLISRTSSGAVGGGLGSSFIVDMGLPDVGGVVGGWLFSFSSDLLLLNAVIDFCDGKDSFRGLLFTGIEEMRRGIIGGEEV